MAIEGNPQVRWEEITDPDGAQKEIFKKSKYVYEECFASEHLESWKHFRKYILETQKRLKGNPDTDPKDYYLVGVIGNEVHGMALLTTYRKEHLAFISYFGVDIDDKRLCVALGNKGVLELRGRVKEEEIRAILFEEEKTDLEETHKDKWTVKRMETLKLFQKHGARKISWLLYKQPILESATLLKLGPEEIEKNEDPNLHLMILYTTQEHHGYIKAPKSCSRGQVRGYLDFVYNTFYKDGFKVTENPIQKAKAKEYLNEVTKRVFASIPSDLEEIPLHEIELEPQGVTVFISYTEKDSLELARLLAGYLKDKGIIVRYWDKDAPEAAGMNIDKAITNWVEKSDAVVGLVTEGTLKSWGTIGDFDKAKEREKLIILLLDKETPPETYQEIKDRVKNFFDRPIYIEFRRSRFDIAAEEVEKCILKLKVREKPRT